MLRLLERCELPEPARLLLTSTHHAVDAYRQHRLLRFDQSRVLLLTSMALDAELVVRHARPEVATHMVQLGQNLVRVASVEGDRRGAVAALGAICAHLAGAGPWPWPTDPAVAPASWLGPACRRDWVSVLQNHRAVLAREVPQPIPAGPGAGPTAVTGVPVPAPGPARRRPRGSRGTRWAAAG